MIYTRKGDKGKTDLLSGERCNKDSPRIEAIGAVDELNSFLGLARAYNRDREIEGILFGLQKMLFIVGSELATKKMKRIIKNDIKDLERIISHLESKIIPIKRFVIPSGNEFISALHIARAVCRRTERRIVALTKKEKINPELIAYMNRLSSLLFVLARYASLVYRVREEFSSEEKWKHEL